MNAPKHIIAQFRTFSNVTRSAACSRVSSEMSSTILEILGSEGVAGGGGDVWCDVASVAVARHRRGGETLERLNEKYSLSYGSSGVVGIQTEKRLLHRGARGNEGNRRSGSVGCNEQTGPQTRHCTYCH